MKEKIYKVHAPKDLIVSAMILMLGVGLFFVNRIAGVSMAVAAVVLFLIYKSGYKMEGSDVLLKNKNLELSRHCRASVLDFIQGKSQELHLIHGNDGGTILLQTWFNKEEHVAYVCLSDYVDFDFQKVTEILQLSDEQAQKLISAL